MSNVNAVAVATEGLKALVQHAFDEAGAAAVSGARVSAVRPGSIPADFRGVNLFLYLVTPNAALRNDDLPTRRSSGELIRRPQLAIDLHYLLTFVGDEAALEPQRILGATAAGLHAHPELTPEDIEEIAETAPPDSYLRLHNDLAQQVERIRFTFATLSTEELSKLWLTFPQKQYELSAALQASVVLIEAPLTPAVRRPVLRRGIYTGLPRPPVLTTIAPLLTPRTVGTERARLTLEGTALSGDATRVRLGNLDPVAPVTADDVRVVVAIPDGLRAGIHAAQVLVAHTFSGTEAPRRFELASNTLLFVLEPRITTASPLAASVGGTLTIGVEPAIAPRQQVRLIVGDLAIPWLTPRAVGPGRYPLRVEVDGALSTLVDPPDGAPPGTVASPFVEVT
jgi:hypothetical protein